MKRRSFTPLASASPESSLRSNGTAVDEPGRLPAEIGGYRVVRRLGGGQRAEVYLGHAAALETTPAETVALKLVRSAARSSVTRPDDGIARELEALSRAAGPHVVRLRDLAPDGQGGVALCLERAPRPALVSLLAEHGGLGLGECVTVLAPLAATVDRIHRLGVSHGALTAGHVLFSADGAPVIVGWGGAHCADGAPSPHELESGAGYRRDRDSLAAITRMLLESATPPRGRVSEWAGSRVAELIDWMERSGGSGDFAGELERRLFALAPPEPVRFERAERALSASPARIGRPLALDGSEGPGTAADTASPGWLHAILAQLGAPEWLDAALTRRRAAGAITPLAPLLARGVASLRAVRAPLWWLAGGVAAALVAALALLPESDGGAKAATTEHTPPPSGAAVPPTAGEDATLGDDPVTAATVLLERRAECLRQLSVGCLDGVAQQGSSALEADSAAVHAAREGAEPPGIPASAPTLVQRLGDGALLSVGDQTHPASILIMRTEAGWRIRDYWQP